MPYVRKDKTVYKKEGGKLVKKGSSATVAKAKEYLKALYANSSEGSSVRGSTRKRKRI